jgi:hypothetical protein
MHTSTPHPECIRTPTAAFFMLANRLRTQSNREVSNEHILTPVLSLPPFCAAPRLDPFTLPPNMPTRHIANTNQPSAGTPAVDGAMSHAITTSIAAALRRPVSSTGRVTPGVGKHAPGHFGKREAEPDRSKRETKFGGAQVIVRTQPDGRGRNALGSRREARVRRDTHAEQLSPMRGSSLDSRKSKGE